jgi:hypothetical protein
MKPDDFETKLHRQRLRPIPGEWRADILAAAARRPDLSSKADAAAMAPWPGPTVRQRLAGWFWPHPMAWAGMGALWVLLLGIHFSLREKPPFVTEAAPPTSAEALVELRQQEKLYAELLGPREPQAAIRHEEAGPQPRSQRAIILAS